jgi:hypothetical protein
LWARDGRTYAHALQQILGVLVDIELAIVVELSKVEGRDLGDVLILSLTLLFLKLEGDAADRASLDTLHQVGGEAGNLVSQSLAGNDGDLIDDALVGLKVEGEARVVSLDAVGQYCQNWKTRGWEGE